MGRAMTVTFDASWTAIDRRLGHWWQMQGAQPQQAGRFDPAHPGAVPPGPVLICGDPRLAGLPGGLAPLPAKPGDLMPLPAPRQAGAEPAQTWLCPGLQQQAPRDLLEGAETAIAGFLALNPRWDGVICLPGPRTHWAQISAEEVVSVQSFLSLTLAGALEQDRDPDPDAERDPGPERQAEAGSPPDAKPGPDPDILAEAAADTLSRPEALAQRLNAARAAGRLDADPPSVARARVLGALIGAELAAARPYWLGQQIAVLGLAGDAAPYLVALRAQAAMVTEADAAPMIRAGLVGAWRRLAGA